MREHRQKRWDHVWAVCCLMGSLLLTACVTESSSGSFTPDVSRERALENYLQLSRGYLEQGDLESARRHLENAENIDANNSEVYGIKALVFARQGDLEEAEESFRQALGLDGDNSQTRNNFAAFLFSNGRYEEAYEQLEQVVQDTDYPGRARAFENLGLAALRLGRDEAALNAFGRALQLNPNQVRSILELANLHYRRGEFAQSRRYFDNYLTIQEFYNLAHSPTSLWLGIRLAREEGDSAQEAEYAGMLQSVYPDSIQNQIYMQSLSNE